MPPTPTEVALRPLTARSVVLSLLLGAHPPEMTARDIVRAGETFTVSEPTLRVALTRMVASGDLLRSDSTYRLSDRLVARQRRQDESIDPRTVAFRARWEMAVVTVSGRRSSERAELRTALSRLRLAELREGVWTRPANLRRTWPAEVTTATTRFVVHPDQPATALAATLWPLDEWTITGRLLLAAYNAEINAAHRLVTAAAIVRHLSVDPVLPDELLPAAWPGPELRITYAAYRAELIDLVGTTRGAG